MNDQPTTEPRMDASPMWRLFLAIPLPDEVRAELEDLTARLKKGAQFTRCRPSWVHAGSIHLTLAFLGNTPPDKVDAISGAASRVAAAFSPLRIEIKRLGVFPDWHHPRVLWAGLRDRTHQLEDLQRKLNDSLSLIGFRPDDKPFRPHLTLARIKSLTGVTQLRSVVESHQDFHATAFDAGRLVLFRSQLDPAGAIHTPLGRFDFSAPPASIHPSE
ncbi:RNA 2',3'-cyclic phosphodiesterase [bacterium]|nr:RNA 2',3'-cyclic phosphodiesterase [bacterium]